MPRSVDGGGERSLEIIRTSIGSTPVGRRVFARFSACCLPLLGLSFGRPRNRPRCGQQLSIRNGVKRASSLLVSLTLLTASSARPLERRVLTHRPPLSLPLPLLEPWSIVALSVRLPLLPPSLLFSPSLALSSLSAFALVDRLA